MRKLFQHLVFAAAILYAAPANAKITVAIIAPMAGDYLTDGEELIKGAEYALAQINKDGGLLKQKLTLLKIDDQCKDNIAVSTAQMLTILKQKKVKLVIGPYCTNSFDKITDIYAKAGIFQIIPVTVNPAYAKITQKGLVKMLGYTSEEAKDFFAFYNTHFAGEKVALLYSVNDSESASDIQAFAREFQKHGKSSVVTTYNYQMTNKDYNALAEKILADGANLAFLLGSVANIRKMAYALREQREDFVIFTNKYAAGKPYFDKLGDYADGTYFTALRGPSDNPEFAEILVEMRLNDFEADGLSFYGYSALKLWQALVEKSKSFDYDKLSAAANNKTIHTVFGDRIFQNGAPKNNEKYSVYRFEGGEFGKIY